MFVKRPADPEAAAAEIQGLRWLAEAGKDFVVAVPPDIDGADGVVATVRLGRCAPTAGQARRAGELLAVMHRAGAEAFGSPPAPGGVTWRGRTFIGRLPQQCVPTADWGEFYVTQRVMPFAEQAHARGNLDTRGLAVVETACAAVAGADFSAVPVSRIHGDLWAGNLLFTPDGPKVIDPAAHGGHAETDLGMLALFGAPFFNDIIDGYRSVTPLDPDWADFTALHQLHPLAVHATTHGPGYAGELVEAARRTLAVIG
nr:fructosamine kinase family protein [Corynebacterium mendelii]